MAVGRGATVSIFRLAINLKNLFLKLGFVAWGAQCVCMNKFTSDFVSCKCDFRLRLGLSSGPSDGSVGLGLVALCDCTGS